MLDRDFLPRRYAVLISIQKVKAIPAIFLRHGWYPSYLAGVSGLFFFSRQPFLQTVFHRDDTVQLRFTLRAVAEILDRAVLKEDFFPMSAVLLGGILTFSPE